MSTHWIFLLQKYFIGLRWVFVMQNPNAKRPTNNYLNYMFEGGKNYEKNFRKTKIPISPLLALCHNEVKNAKKLHLSLSKIYTNIKYQNINKLQY